MSERERENPTWEQIQRDRDERVELPLEPNEALRGLLEVDPEADPVESSVPQKGYKKPA